MFDVACGVIVAVKPVSAKVVVVVVRNVVSFALSTTCNMRNAPRKLFIVADASVLDVKDAGNEVGVAMLFPLYENVGAV